MSISNQRKKKYVVRQLNPPPDDSPRPATRSRFSQGDRILYYSQSSNTWVNAVVVKVMNTDRPAYRVIREDTKQYRLLKPDKTMMVMAP